MAVDTAAKRYQMLNLSSGDVLPIPDGTIAQADRQHFLNLYGGILAAALSSVYGTPTNAVIYQYQTANVAYGVNAANVAYGVKTGEASV